ncbi:MAG: hypothetical protein JW809_17665 [Pirellulales bacterium]|nr:hypothetical protein [Pirellulales bacterium]
MKRAFLPSTLVVVLAIVRGWPSPAAAQSVWEMTPYRVQLIVAVEPRLAAGGTLEEDLRRGLVERIEAVVGVLWDASAPAPSPRLRHRVVTALDGLQVDDLPDESLKGDKVFCIAVGPGPAGGQVAVRELDVRTRVFGPAVRSDVLQPAKYRDAALRAVFKTFTPLATIVESTGKTASLRLRGAALPLREPSLQTIRRGDVLVPMIRYNDRDGNVRKVGPIPWTYLVVDQYDQRAFQCTVYSALYGPLSGRRRGRVEQLALLAKPVGRSTRVVLTDRNKPNVPLAGYEVYSQAPGSKTTTLLGQTDASGAVIVPATDHPLRLLVVKSGASLLARLPVVPGLEPQLTADVPGDDERLQAEGYTTGVQEDLVDVVTRRQILIFRAEKLIDQEQYDKAEQLVEELRDLPKRDQMLRQLREQEEKFASADPRAKKKIEERFEETRRLLDRFLDTAPIEKLDRELTAARKGERAPAAAPSSPPAGAAPAPANPAPAAGAAPAPANPAPASSSAAPAPGGAVPAPAPAPAAGR